EHVECGIAIANLPGQPAYAGLRGQVGDERADCRALSRHRLCLSCGNPGTRVVAPHDDDILAECRKRLGGGEPDAIGPARDHDCLCHRGCSEVISWLAGRARARLRRRAPPAQGLAWTTTA